MEKAIRVAIEESVKLIVAKTPLLTTGLPPCLLLRPRHRLRYKPDCSRCTFEAISLDFVFGASNRVRQMATASLREGPGTNFKTLLEVKKGTGLAVLEEKGQWLWVRLEDGQEDG